jgi:hypothetical protein
MFRRKVASTVETPQSFPSYIREEIAARNIKPFEGLLNLFSRVSFPETDFSQLEATIKEHYSNKEAAKSQLLILDFDGIKTRLEGAEEDLGKLNYAPFRQEMTASVAALRQEGASLENLIQSYNDNRLELFFRQRLATIIDSAFNTVNFNVEKKTNANLDRIKYEMGVVKDSYKSIGLSSKELDKLFTELDGLFKQNPASRATLTNVTNIRNTNQLRVELKIGMEYEDIKRYLDDQVVRYKQLRMNALSVASNHLMAYVDGIDLCISDTLKYLVAVVNASEKVFHDPRQDYLKTVKSMIPPGLEGNDEHLDTTKQLGHINRAFWRYWQRNRTFNPMKPRDMDAYDTNTVRLGNILSNIRPQSETRIMTNMQQILETYGFKEGYDASAHEMLILQTVPLKLFEKLADMEYFNNLIFSQAERIFNLQDHLAAVPTQPGYVNKMLVMSSNAVEHLAQYYHSGLVRFNSAVADVSLSMTQVMIRLNEMRPRSQASYRALHSN